MATMASLVSLGSSVASCSGSSFEVSFSLVENVSYRRRACSCNFRHLGGGRRWRYVSVCRMSVITDYISEAGNVVSLENALKESESENRDTILKPFPKPVLKAGPDEERKAVGNTVTWDESSLKLKEEERKKIIESLDEVLDKAEKLQTWSSQSNGRKDGAPVNRPTNVSSSLANGRPSNTWVKAKPRAGGNSVWRKGSPVSAVQNVVRETPKTEKVEGIAAGTKGERKLEGQTREPIRLPLPPQRPEVQLQARTSVAAPPPPKELVLKNVGMVPATDEKDQGNNVWRKGDLVSAVQNVVRGIPKTENVEGEEVRTKWGRKLEGQTREPFRPPLPPQSPEVQLQARPSVAPPPLPKKPLLKGVGMVPSTDEKDQVTKKERKPILIDKFAATKSAVDPMAAQAVKAPPKPSKFPSVKFKDDYRKKSAPAGGPRRRMVANDEIHDEETSELGLSIPGAARKGRKWNKASRKAARRQAARDAAPVKVEILEVGEKGMSTEELAYNLAVSEGEILGYLYSKGIKPDGVQTLDNAMVKMICERYDVEVLDTFDVELEQMAKKKEIFDDADLDNLEDRPPVLTIMGHVDHGKTTLLDYIRKSKVAASEAGGITQGIGAYKVEVPVDGKFLPCVFLDTPGHEAFGAMRARGARVTDIAIIVVAADDGIRPQTNEAIAHAKAAGVPIVVAINKIDKDGASPDRVMQELSSIGLMPEDWGGGVPMIRISALKGDNIDELLETAILVAELLELKANPHRNAKGTVIEAGLHKSRGPVATFIVQNGTLKKGDIIVCGEAFGKVRALFDHGGKNVDEAGPSIPVQVTGLNNVPFAGDEFEVVNTLDMARVKAEERAESLREERIAEKAGDGRVTLSSLASAVSVGKVAGLDLHQLNIIMKVDVQGSIEAVRQALEVLPQDNVTLKFLLQATGDVSTSDIDLAVASKAVILGFNVKAPGPVEKYADNRGVEIRLYKVIYDLIDDMRSAMEGLLDTVEEQVPIGVAQVRATFSTGSGQVAGCMVKEGKVVKGCGVRVVRKGKVVHIGVLKSLRRVKDTVEEVNAGLECGIGVEDYDEFEEGDTLEAFNAVQKKRTLEEASAQVAAALDGARVN